MQKLTKTILGSTTLAGLATLAPLSFNAGAVTTGGSPIRISEACGQYATSCKVASGYICSTAHGYIYNAICATGCGS